jgi:DNA repair protein RecO (recombination protein O)
MLFKDEGIIISQKKYGENSLIVKVFSRHHGIYCGFVGSVKSMKEKIIFQTGNLISFEFRCHIEENLGRFLAVDLVRSYCAKIMFERIKLDCVNSLFMIINSSFAEREKHEKLFEKLQIFLQQIGEESTGKNFLADYVKLELKILKTLGYGIDLSSCVVTNCKTNLAFVSQKSARAVCFEAGKPYQNKLLKLPNFLTDGLNEINDEDILNGLRLSRFFLEKFIFEKSEKLLNSRKKLEQNFFAKLSML